MSKKENKQIRIVAYTRIPNSSKNDCKLQAKTAYYSDLVSKRSDCKYIDIYADIVMEINGKRPEFDRMLVDAYSGKFDYVIVEDFSEFSRDINEFTQAIKQLKSLGVGVYFIGGNIDTLNSYEISLLLRLAA